MNKEIKCVYVYETKCLDCGKCITIYYTLPDFGDAPFLRKCIFCDTLYWYSADDEYYIRPLAGQIEGKVCEKCKSALSESLVPTHTHLVCCNNTFSLDDDFVDSVDLDGQTMKSIEVYLIY